MRLILLYVCSCFFLSCGRQGRLEKSSGAGTDYVITGTGLKYKIIQKGTGQKAKAGQEILLLETTSYSDGTILYSNEKSKIPVKVLIGGNQATNAVDEGLRGMRKGEIRQLIAHPGLVKRKSYPSNVSPDSTLIIKIILIKIL